MLKLKCRTYLSVPVKVMEWHEVRRVAVKAVARLKQYAAVLDALSNRSEQGRNAIAKSFGQTRGDRLLGTNTRPSRNRRGKSCSMRMGSICAEFRMQNKMYQQALRLEKPARLCRDIGASFADPKEFVPLFSLAALDLTPN